MVIKKFFRFLRGEINGYYLTKLAYFVNSWVQDNIMPPLYYIKVFQFDLQEMTDIGYRDQFIVDLFNIAKTAGLTQILAKGTLLTNLLHMTESQSEATDGPCFTATGTEMDISFEKQISERGLYDVKKEGFDFRYWNASTPDIVDNATDKLQATLVPAGRTPKGYIPQDGIIYDQEGNYTGRDVQSTPPSGDVPYTDYYGEEFMHLGEDFLVFRKIPEDILYNLVLIVQYVRYNGSSTKSFAELTSLIVGPKSSTAEQDQGFISLKAHTYTSDLPYVVTWVYTNDTGKSVDNRALRLEIWFSLVESFFPQIVLVEDIKTKTVKRAKKE